jgi:type II secretory pathway pseudopilin PulG
MGWLRKPIGATLVTIAVFATGGAITLPFITNSGGTAIACTQTISTLAAFNTALNTTGSSGKTICVTADINGSITTSTAMTSEARFVAQPRDNTIEAPDLNFTAGAANITIDGFEFANNSQVTFVSGAISNIHYVRNYCHDQLATCVIAGNGATVTNAWVVGSRFYHITMDGNFPHGYATYDNGATWNGLKWDYNDCVGTGGGAPTDSVDCFENNGAVNNSELVANDVSGFQNGTDHSDGFSILPSNVLVKDNRLINVFENYFVPNGQDLTLQNNLIIGVSGVNPPNVGVLSYGDTQNGHDIQPLRWTLTNNTVWGWSLDIGMTLDPQTTAGRGSNVLQKNIFGGMSCKAGFTTGDHNASPGVEPCTGFGATNQFGFTPTFTSTWFTDGVNANYQVSNLPVGYEDVGYHPAPFGPSACPTALCR